MKSHTAVAASDRREHQHRSHQRSRLRSNSSSDSELSPKASARKTGTAASSSVRQRQQQQPVGEELERVRGIGSEILAVNRHHVNDILEGVRVELQMLSQFETLQGNASAEHVMQYASAVQCCIEHMEEIATATKNRLGDFMKQLKTNPYEQAVAHYLDIMSCLCLSVCDIYRLSLCDER